MGVSYVGLIVGLGVFLALMAMILRAAVAVANRILPKNDLPAEEQSRWTRMHRSGLTIQIGHEIYRIHSRRRKQKTSYRCHLLRFPHLDLAVPA